MPDPVAVVEEVGSVRVRYGETDQMHFAYHGHAAVWFDMARTELLRQHGHCYRDLENQGLWLPVLALHVDYHLAARYDDKLSLAAGFRPTFVGVRPSSLQFEIAYQVRRGRDLCFSGWTRHCFLKLDGGGERRPVRIPEGLRDLLTGAAPLWSRVG